MDKILVLDFGSQTTQLIARRIRDIGVYSEIISGDSDLAEVVSLNSRSEVKGIVLSGSPFSVYEKDSPAPDSGVYDLGIPILGICYGFHQIASFHKGQVEARDTKEYGRAATHFISGSELFDGVPDGFISWMSHGDSVSKLPENFTILAKSDNFIASAVDLKNKLFGIQFHPEVTHCEYGSKILENFAVRICGARKEWNMDRYLELVIDELRHEVADQQVLLLISGGVDSTVVAGLLLRALDPGQIHLMYIDTGLMRKEESVEVEINLRKLGAKNLHLINASADFLDALKGVEEPEEKRKIIGDLFMRIQERETQKYNIDAALLAQGTLYTDMIESGKGVGKKAHVIKSHHNVRSPLVEAKRETGLLVEPLSRLYKDEVRRLGEMLGIPKKIVGRHPFPGPGLAVRIIGEITKDRCDILREADAIFIDELRKRKLYDDIWQAFCVLLPVRSVGVTGDARNYGYVLALRAIVSLDGMTADVYPIEMQVVLEISSRITNTVKQIGRVVYDVSSKPPATIEWE